MDKGGHSKKSMLIKSRERSRAKKKLNRNFTSGVVDPNEHYLNRVGLRGRKRWVCLSVFVVAYLIAVAHLVLTCVILGVLRFTATGPSSLSFQRNGDLVWREGANITDVRLANPSLISTYSKQPLGIHGDQKNEVVFQAALSGTAAMSELRVTDTSVNFEPQDSLCVHSSESGEQLLFTNSTYTELRGLTHLENLVATRITTNRVMMRNESTTIESSQRLAMRGAAGVFIGGSQVEISSAAAGGGTISLSSQATLQLGGRDGVRVLSIPTTTPAGANQQSHLCACSNGRLFLVPQNSMRCAAALNMLPTLCT